MDHAWAAEQLKDFRTLLDDYFRLDSWGNFEYEPDEEDVRIHDDLIEKYGSWPAVSDLLISRNPIIRQSSRLKSSRHSAASDLSSRRHFCCIRAFTDLAAA